MTGEWGDERGDRVMDVVIGFAVYVLLIVALAVWRDHHDAARPRRHRKPEEPAAAERRWLRRPTVPPARSILRHTHRTS
jgi:hypothetical protein